MIERVKYGGIKFPKLYAAWTRADAEECRRLGVPYVKVRNGWTMEDIAKYLLYGWLCRHWPMVDWGARLFNSQRDRAKVPKVRVVNSVRPGPTDGSLQSGMTDDSMEQSDGYRKSDGEGCRMELDDMAVERELKCEDYLDGDPNFHVDVEDLQSLRLLPKFAGDVADAIRCNLDSVAWADGWSKKYDAQMGSYNMGQEARNLIVVDTSGSIPSSVAATMMCLVDTLRTQANADLIITGFSSRFYARGDELPDPNRLCQLIGGANECVQFYRILTERVAGRKWGNVIVFGDNDAPDDWRFREKQDGKPEGEVWNGTSIENLVCFHTYRNAVPGYGLWARDLIRNQANITISTDWVKEA